MADDERFQRLEQLFDTLSVGQEQMLKQMDDVLQLMQRRKETGAPNPRSDQIAPTGELLSCPILTKLERAEAKKVKLTSAHLESDAQIWIQKKKKLKPQGKREEFKSEINIHSESASYEDGFEMLTTFLTRINESRRNEGRCWAQDFKPNPSPKYWADPNHPAPTRSNTRRNRSNTKPPTPILRFTPSEIPPREREMPPARARKFFVGCKVEGEEERVYKYVNGIEVPKWKEEERSDVCVLLDIINGKGLKDSEVNDVVDEELVNGDTRFFGEQKLLLNVDEPLDLQETMHFIRNLRDGLWAKNRVKQLQTLSSSIILVPIYESRTHDGRRWACDYEPNPTSKTHQEENPNPINLSIFNPNIPSFNENPNPSKPSPPAHRFTPIELQKRREHGLCYHCEGRATSNHACKRLFLIKLQGDESEEIEEGEDSTEGFLTSMVGNLVFTVLIDSGSTHNSPLVKLAGLRVEENSSLREIVADEEKLQSLGLCREVPISLKHTQFLVYFHLINLESCDWVLKAQWLRTLGPLIWNLENLGMEIKVGNQNVKQVGVQDLTRTLRRDWREGMLLQSNLVNESQINRGSIKAKVTKEVMTDFDPSFCFKLWVYGVQRGLPDILYGDIINCVVMKVGFGLYLCTAVSEFYDKHRYIDNAHKVFDELIERDLVYLRLRNYQQHSVEVRTKNKLSPRYHGPYKVLGKVGVVAYRLELPPGSKIHPVFHVSLLKKHVAGPVSTITHPPNWELSSIQEPAEVLVVRTLANQDEVLVRWQGSPKTAATWESQLEMQAAFLSYSFLEDKEVFKGKGVVR